MSSSLGYAYAADSNDAPTFTWREVFNEHRIVEVLHSKPEPGEQIEAAFRRKECELRALFAELSIQDCRELHRRLALLLSGDPIAARFRLLIASRQTRLIAFLADARRRHAMGAR